MKNLHLSIGVLGIIAFLLTGQYMDIVHNHLKNMPDALRMEYRSVHIYILFSAILNVVLGTYYRLFTHRLISLVQHLASIIFLILPVLFLISFFSDITVNGIERPMARNGIYLALLAATLTLCISIAKYVTDKKQVKT